MFLSPAPGAVIIEYLLSVTRIATGEVGMLNMVKKKMLFSPPGDWGDGQKPDGLCHSGGPGNGCSVYCDCACADHLWR